MNDPATGIPPQIINHVHFICTHQYPFVAILQVNQAFQYLLDAPRIVKQVAPMALQYLSGPADGTIFLTYSPPRLMDNYPSDGYMWDGQEERHVQDFGGYTLEIGIQHAGFRPGVDAMACHQRRRYRLVAKNPNVNANPPDRNLWIVHYSRAEQHRTIPASQVGITQAQSMTLQSRQWIESQGRLEPHEFMLHDRERWPVVKHLPGRGWVSGSGSGGGSVGPGMAHLSNPRFAGQMHQQQAQGGVGPSPAKRQRTSAGGPMPGMVQMPEYVDEDIEGENNAGDLLDVMSQREVSFHRFKQHHEWMEEVVSSPYAIRQIEPVYLGLGLMGELSGLTKGVFETVDAAAQQLLRDVGGSEKEYQVGKIPQDKMKEFSGRVNSYLEEGQAEIKRMKEEHAQKMNEMRRGKSLIKAEKRLRNAKWVEDGPTPPTLNGLVSGRDSTDKADAIIAEVESIVGSSVHEQSQLKLVEAGGLKEKIVQQPEALSNGYSGTQQHNGFSFDGNSHSLNGTAPLQRPPQANSGPQITQQRMGAPQTQPSIERAVPSASAPAVQQQAAAPDTNMDFGNDPEEPMTTLNEDESNFNIDDMELDMTGNPDFDFEAAGAGETPQGDESIEQAAVNTSGATANSTAQAAHAANGSAAAHAGQADQLAVPAATTATTATGQDASFHPTPGDNSAFDEFTAGEDELINFGEDGGDLDLGMEGSAFGDAFQGGGEGGEGGGDGQTS